MLVRDPLYGFIGLSKFEQRLVDSKVMQRLTRIKQLGHTYLVYPSSMHSRFEHSLGALYVAGRICDELGLPRENKKLVRSVVLLHDIGHGPFSHVFEEILKLVAGDGFSHEDATRLILENDAELKRLLGNDRKDILGLFEKEKGHQPLLCGILSGSLDADKLDYLRRDSYHTGVAYGMFDFERIIHNICRIENGLEQYIGLHEKAEDAIESYRLARYLMQSQVYEHHTRLIADDMFIRAIRSAFEEPRVFDVDALNPESNAAKFVKYLLSLDDHSISQMIISGSNEKAKKIMINLLNRRLLKRSFMLPINITSISDWRTRNRLLQMDKEDIAQLEKRITSEAGLEADQVIVHLQSMKITLYEKLGETALREERPILIKHYDGSVVDLNDESPFSAQLVPIRRLYVFSPETSRERVKEITENIIGVSSRYTPPKAK